MKQIWGDGNGGWNFTTIVTHLFLAAITALASMIYASNEASDKDFTAFKQNWHNEMSTMKMYMEQNRQYIISNQKDIIQHDVWGRTQSEAIKETMASKNWVNENFKRK